MDRAAMARLTELADIPRLLAAVPADHRDSVLDRSVVWLDARRDYRGYAPGGGRSLAAANRLHARMLAAEQLLVDTIARLGLPDPVGWTIALGEADDRAAAALSAAGAARGRLLGPDTITPGDYLVGTHHYRVQATKTGMVVRRLRRTGRPTRSVLGRITAPDTIIPTTNGAPHADRLTALAAAPHRHRTALHCAWTGCGAVLTDPVSMAIGLGPEHRHPPRKPRRRTPSEDPVGC